MPERVAVITGGAGDLARTVASQLRQNGLQVHNPGRDALDVTNEESVSAFFNQLERVDLLINNAGARQDGLCAGMSEAAWEHVMAVNLRGAFLCSRVAAMKMMR